MSNTKLREPNNPHWAALAPAGVISIIPSMQICVARRNDLIPFLRLSFGAGSELVSLETSFSQRAEAWASLVVTKQSVGPVPLGSLIYTYHFRHSAAAGLIPPVATIGATVSTMHKRKNASKAQLVSKQVARSSEHCAVVARRIQMAPLWPFRAPWLAVLPCSRPDPLVR